ncbi:MAG: Rrf2 family transcriptional regulator [Planctomycetes bacterium]|nr:Rrf2 family transcriptional regulator [Planctomycetota bacterium]
MKLSTRVRYAVRAVMDLGTYSEGNLVLLKEIAKRQHVSVKYLENIFASLRKADIVKGVRGAKGGYKLAREASGISVYDIVLAMQGFVAPVGCVEDSGTCGETDDCVAREVWFEVSEAVSKVLKRFTIEEMIRRQETKKPIPCPELERHTKRS